MDDEMQYKYQRIDLATDAIRIVRLLKGFRREPIQCELFETFLHQAEGVPYEALSYAWGDSPVAYGISINDRRSFVGENLHMALLALRQTDEDRLLWIDAICIDQSNNEEKGHQVGQMRLISQGAQQVVVWLGPSNLEIDFLMNMTGRWDHQTRQRPGAQHKQSWTDSWTRLTVDETGLYKDEVTARRRNSLKEILDRPWFRRVWILQEVASADKATILCGSKAMSSQGFRLLPFLLNVGLDHLTEAVLDILPGHHRKETWWGEKQNLETLLLKFGTSEATDHRDKIYALLGIASDARASNNTLLPDYTVSLGRAICHTIAFLLFDEAYDPSARPLPDGMDFTTFLGTLPRLSDYVLCWALQEHHDVTAAAVVPKVVNINTLYHQNITSTVVAARSPLSLIMSSSASFDRTLCAIMERDDANVLFGDNALVQSVNEGRAEMFKRLVQHPSAASSGLGTIDAETFLQYAAVTADRESFERITLILTSSTRATASLTRAMRAINAITSDGRIWIKEWLFDYLKPLQGRIAIDSYDLFETLAILHNKYHYAPKEYLAVVLLAWKHKAKGGSLSFERIEPIALDGPRPEPWESVSMHVLIDGKDPLGQISSYDSPQTVGRDSYYLPGEPYDSSKNLY